MDHSIAVPPTSIGNYSTLWRNAAWLGLLLLLTIASNHAVSMAAPTYIHPVHFESPLEILSAFALIVMPLPLFLVAEFSFGYFVGVYMYVMVAGFVVLSYSTEFHYDYAVARISAVTSLVAFLVPALFLHRLRMVPTPSTSSSTFDKIAVGILIFAFVIVAWDAQYGFRIAGFYQSMSMRSDLIRPKLLNYASDMLTCSVLPFCLAYFISRRRWYLAGASVVIALCFFPVLLNKIVLFAPAWTVVLFFLFSRIEAKKAVVLTLIVPMTVAGAYYLVEPIGGFHWLGIVNSRMIATPSIALDHYFAFFSSHPLTHFCQINFVKALTACPYSDQLGVIMEGVYHQGNFNGSLFTTEGIASVGPLLSPLATFACGIAIGLGNVASSRLPPALIAASCGALINILMNVPLSTSMLSNGGALLFLLWLFTPNKDHSLKER
jgi:hypothetical protein